MRRLILCCTFLSAINFANHLVSGERDKTTPKPEQYENSTTEEKHRKKSCGGPLSMLDAEAESSRRFGQQSMPHTTELSYQPNTLSPEALRALSAQMSSGLASDDEDCMTSRPPTPSTNKDCPTEIPPTPSSGKDGLSQTRSHYDLPSQWSRSDLASLSDNSPLGPQGADEGQSRQIQCGDAPQMNGLQTSLSFNSWSTLIMPVVVNGFAQKAKN